MLISRPLTKNERSILTCLDCGSTNKPLHEEGCTAPQWHYQYSEESVLNAISLFKEKCLGWQEKVLNCEDLTFSHRNGYRAGISQALVLIDECFQIGVKN